VNIWPVGSILIVEDDATMAEMVAYNLRRQGLEVQVANDGRQGLAAGKAKGVSLVVLDRMLPGMDGFAIAKELRDQRPDLPILMVTARGEETSKLAGFAAGVDDYLTKPFSMEELVARVKALLRRSRLEAQRTVAPDEIVFGDLKLNPRDFLCWISDEEIDLRPKELSLLATMAAEPGRLFSRTELADLVWGYTVLGETRTIDTHVKNLRRKVEGPSGYTFIETVRGVGYRFRVKPKDDK
jgi:two-component system, OmpR family, alkaline phosphatase synthesis response regulator PhoP